MTSGVWQYVVHVGPLANEGFEAIVPELPGCRSDGETPAQALYHAYDAIGCWMEAAEEMGRVVPEPRHVAA